MSSPHSPASASFRARPSKPNGIVFAVAVAFLVVIPERNLLFVLVFRLSSFAKADLLLSLQLPLPFLLSFPKGICFSFLYFACHPSPKAEDLLSIMTSHNPSICNILRLRATGQRHNQV
jgi:hypothetical protein